jgi:hypothetical protein
MSDSSVRHTVAGLATLAGFLAYFSGYISGQHGFWWTFIGVGVIYYALYHLIEV